MKNKITKIKGERGFISMVILILIALVLLKYAYNIDVIGFLTTGKFKLWLDKLWNML